MAIEIVSETEEEATPEQGVEETEADTVQVHVDVELPEEEAVTEEEEEPVTVTVVNEESDAVEAVVTEQVIEDAVTLAVLEERFNQLQSEVWQLQGEVSAMRAVQEVEAQAIVTEADALEEFEEEQEEEEEEDTEEREPNSAGVHPLYKPWRDFFGKGN